jgi:hypothetical protein
MPPQLFVVPSGQKFDPKKLPGKATAKSGSTKPKGNFLWTSSLKGRESDWTKFTEGPGQEDLASSGDRVVFSVRPSAKVLHVTNKQEFLWAWEEFFYQTDWMHEEELIYLDWEKISKEYDGFHFGGGGWPGPYTSRPEWNTLYGWDAESTVWFNPKVLDFQRILKKGKQKK